MRLEPARGGLVAARVSPCRCPCPEPSCSHCLALPARLLQARPPDESRKSCFRPSLQGRGPDRQPRKPNPSPDKVVASRSQQTMARPTPRTPWRKAVQGPCFRACFALRRPCTSPRSAPAALACSAHVCYNGLHAHQTTMASALSQARAATVARGGRQSHTASTASRREVPVHRPGLVRCPGSRVRVPGSLLSTAAGLAVLIMLCCSLAAAP
jgi:hypothetical protein